MYITNSLVGEITKAPKPSSFDHFKLFKRSKIYYKR